MNFEDKELDVLIKEWQEQDKQVQLAKQAELNKTAQIYEMRSIIRHMSVEAILSMHMRNMISTYGKDVVLKEAIKFIKDEI